MINKISALRKYLKYIALITSLILIGIDQFIKYNVKEYLPKTGTIPIINNVFHLTYAENEGAAFSILEGQTWFLIGVTAIVLVALIIVFLSKKVSSPTLIWSISFVIAGGIGNLIDRAIFGYVVDYLDARIIKGFAIFNFADCFVVIGAAMAIIYFIIIEPKRLKAEKINQKEEQTNLEDNYNATN